MSGRDEAAALDAADALSGFRARFRTDDDLIYLDGNSLGRLPRQTADRLRVAVEEEWGKGLVRSWSDWIDLSVQVGDRMATSLLGAGQGEVVVADSTTVNLYKLASAAIDARPGRRAVVTDDANFPTDRYVLEGLCRARRMEFRVVRSDPIEGPNVDDVTRACSDGEVAAVVLSHVGYRSGALADMDSITEACHRAGALAIWDLCHSAGAVRVDLDTSGADLAVGCTYKYLNGGPGAPAFLYVRSALQGDLRQPIWGWFGQRDQFDMGPAYEPVSGIGSWLSGTPPVLGLVCVSEGVELLAHAGIDQLRDKSRRLTDLLVRLVDQHLAPLGFTLHSPRAAERRGGHVAVRHAEAWRLCQALTEQFGVIPDFRPPDLIRLGPVPIYTRFTEVCDAVERIRAAAETRAWERYSAQRSRVT